MATRIFGRGRESSTVNIGSGADEAVFDSVGVASVSSADEFLADTPDVFILGEPGVDEVEGTAGNATHVVTVPTGKYWRLIGAFHLLITDSNVANRAVVFTTRTAADATIEAITHANVAASTTAKRTTLFGQDDFVKGDRAVASQGTLTMATKPTADDTIVINGETMTWKAALSGANELLIGANVAASKSALEAALVDRDSGGTLHSVSDASFATMAISAVAFSSDDMVISAAVKGAAGDLITTTETFTDGTDAFDAATLGTTTAGLDAADKVSGVDYPTAGAYLTPGEDIIVSCTNGEAGDTLDTYIYYIEYDELPL